jgi:type IV secretion system protein VirD4
MRAVLVLQDLVQLEHIYGRDESIVSNCDTRVAFTPNKFETAELLSRMTGPMTVHKESRMYSGSRLAPMLMHVMASEQETQRPLLTPDECLRLGPDQALVFASGHAPIRGRKLRYYQDTEFARRAAIPAPAVSDRIVHDWSVWIPPAPPSSPYSAPPVQDPVPRGGRGNSLL